MEKVQPYESGGAAAAGGGGGRGKKRARVERISGGYGLAVGAIGQAFGPGVFMAPSYEATLRYFKQVSVSADTHTSVRLNSLFDPETALGGHQPMGFDQITAIYSIYHVHDVDVSVVVAPPDGGTATGFWTITVSQDSTAPSTFERCVEAGAIWGCNAGYGGGRKGQHKLTVDLPKVEGIPRKEYMSRQEFAAEKTVDPANITYLHIGCWGTAGYVTYELQFHARFTGDSFSSPS